MKTPFTFRFLPLCFLLCLSQNYLSAQIAAHAPDRVIVKWKPDRTASQKSALKNRFAANTLKSFPEIGVEVWGIDPNQHQDIAQTLNALQQQTDVVFAEPDYTVAAIATFPGDPSFGELWGMNNTGQGGGMPDADIDAPEAWDMTTGNSDIGYPSI